MSCEGEDMEVVESDVTKVELSLVSEGATMRERWRAVTVGAEKRGR